jgi:hypothetical protein
MSPGAAARMMTEAETGPGETPMRAAREHVRSPVPQTPHVQTPHVSCGRCERAYSLPAWTRLPKVCTLTAAELHRHVIDWREERVVEVRTCAACGRAMARMVARGEGGG